MAHPQVAGEEMAFRYGESFECIEYVDGSLAWRLGGGITAAHHRKTKCCTVSQSVHSPMNMALNLQV
jgi:hypothetical protein